MEDYRRTSVMNSGCWKMWPRFTRKRAEEKKFKFLGDHKISSYKTPFATITKLFGAFGIDAMHKNDSLKAKVIRRLRFRFAIISWSLVALMLASYGTYTFKHMTGKSYFKLRCAKMFGTLNSFSIWCVMFRRRKRISTLTREIACLGRTQRVPPPAKLAQISAYYILFAYFWICFAIFQPYSEARYRNIFDQYTFEGLSIPDDFVFAILIPAFAVHEGFVDIFPWCVAVFYAICCKWLQKMLLAHVESTKRLSRSIISQSFDDCVRRYESVLEAVSTFEAVMSLPIFMTISMTAFGSFFGIVTLSGGNGNSFLAFEGVLMILVINVLAFLLVSYAASGVNGCDAVARSSNNQLIRRALQDGNARMHARMSFFILNNGPAAALSGYGFFYFTKGFIMAAMGCILTYALLLIHL